MIRRVDLINKGKLICHKIHASSHTYMVYPAMRLLNQEVQLDNYAQKQHSVYVILKFIRWSLCWCMQLNSPQ